VEEGGWSIRLQSAPVQFVYVEAWYGTVLKRREIFEVIDSTVVVQLMLKEGEKSKRRRVLELERAAARGGRRPAW
jgi:hypothetical protein